MDAQAALKAASSSGRADMVTLLLDHGLGDFYLARVLMTKKTSWSTVRDQLVAVLRQCNVGPDETATNQLSKLAGMLQRFRERVVANQAAALRYSLTMEQHQTFLRSLSLKVITLHGKKADGSVPHCKLLKDMLSDALAEAQLAPEFAFGSHFLLSLEKERKLAEKERKHAEKERKHALRTAPCPSASSLDILPAIATAAGDEGRKEEEADEDAMLALYQAIQDDLNKLRGTGPKKGNAWEEMRKRHGITKGKNKALEKVSRAQQRKKAREAVALSPSSLAIAATVVTAAGDEDQKDERAAEAVVDRQLRQAAAAPATSMEACSQAPPPSSAGIAKEVSSQAQRVVAVGVPVLLTMAKVIGVALAVVKEGGETKVKLKLGIRKHPRDEQVGSGASSRKRQCTTAA